MSNVRNWVSGLVTATLILLAPVIGFAVVVAAEMLTDLVTKVGAPVVWPVATTALGWVLLRKYGWQPRSSQLRSGEA
jgi:positive regulator of sigma E activity